MKIINMSFCNRCGTQLNGEWVCPMCGTPVNDAVNQNITQELNQPINQNQPYGNYQRHDSSPQPPVQQGSPTSVLVWCIVGGALAWSGIVGLIFSIIGLRKANAYIKQYGPISKQVTVGKIISIIGIVLSSIMTVFWIIWIIAVVIAGVALSGVSSGRPWSYEYSYRYY